MKKLFLMATAALLVVTFACTNRQQSQNTDKSKEDSVLTLAKAFF